MKKVINVPPLHGLEEVRDGFGNTNFKISKPLTQVPVIVGEYQDADGVRMYQCENDRHFIADTYDKMFVPVHKVPKPPKRAPKRRKKKKSSK
ncbi:hypothetical protein LZZ85_11300 [Terrimonas sp. NA20]|uniref:Uncharacterized protein n=1 Tax=Terrimonas ginsenosidimutans TaxID=2908004 RepID=A0ABS9KRD3_9BACT|nr:hypothetical protein [Terrimonas ginsenosidimutans]MCG2614874.1 hypothetical protein [Terrimonas ginsenosidimutans]